MARRKPLSNVTTVFEAVGRGAIEFMNQISVYGVAGKRAVDRLLVRFPNLPRASGQEILETAKSSRNAARKIMAGQLQAGEQGFIVPINPTLRRAYRYQAIAEIIKPGTGEKMTVNVYVDSSKPLGRIAITNQLESVAAQYSSGYFRGAPLTGVVLIAAERKR